MSEHDHFGTFVIGFIVGGIAGAVISLLYAPQSGEETRAVIKEKAIELRDKTSETVGETYKKAEHAATDAVAKAQQMIKTAQKKATELEEKGQVVLEDVKKAKKPAA